MAKEAKSLVCVGIISSAHGIRGQVKIKSYTENPESILKHEIFDENGNSLKIHISGSAGGKIVADVEGVKDRNSAEDIAGTKIYIDKSSLPELDKEEFYYEDLTGLVVKTSDNKEIGKIVAVHNFGAGGVIEIKQHDAKKNEMLPFNKETFTVVDIDTGFVIVNFPEEVIVK